jgi:general secretion pathway protein G
MKRRTVTRKNVRSGFTLLELLLVLIILVVIAGFSIRAVTGTLDGAKKKEAKISVNMYSTMLKEYQLEVGQLPTELEGLHSQPADITDATLWVQKTDKPIKMDPWGKPYEYKSNGSTFELRSVGPDGQSGTADDITP